MDQDPDGPVFATTDLSDSRVRRRMLAEGPVGEWETLPGTHTALMHDVIRFAPDGTGETRGDSVLGGETVERFTWSLVRPGVLSCVVIDEDDQGQPDETQQVGFRFEEQRSDLGTFWVMRDPDGDGFWNLAFPVAPRLTGRRRSEDRRTAAG